MQRRFVVSFFLTLLASSFCETRAGFFQNGIGLDWFQPKKGIVHRPTRSIKEDRNPYNILARAEVIDPRTGKSCAAIDDGLFRKDDNPILNFFNVPQTSQKALLVIMEQLGDFDSMEYASYLKEVLPDLRRANIALRIVGIGSCKTAHMFGLFTGIPLECIRVDPVGNIHSALKLHRGPDWDVPDWLPSKLINWFAKEICGNDNEKIPSKDVARAWLNYMAMCAGIAAPGTLPEIFRGYVGDKSAPELLGPDDTVRAGPLEIRGTTDVKFGPIRYKSLWKNEEGYLRPAELATTRLKNMVEVLTKFEDYVPDQRLLDWRGATFLLDKNCQSGDVPPLYEHRNPGVLTYSETMPRPLSFLEDYIGKKALNPLGLSDPVDGNYVKARSVKQVRT